MVSIVRVTSSEAETFLRTHSNNRSRVQKINKEQEKQRQTDERKENMWDRNLARRELFQRQRLVSSKEGMIDSDDNSSRQESCEAEEQRLGMEFGQVLGQKKHASSFIN